MYNLEYILLMAPAEGEGGNPMMQFIFFGAIILIFYFFMIRPQMKKAKEQKSFTESLQKGTKVVTNGGIMGTIVKMDEVSIIIQTEDETKLRILKSAISLDNTKIANPVK